MSFNVTLDATTLPTTAQTASGLFDVSMTTVVLAVVASFLLFQVTGKKNHNNPQNLPLPPGPKGLPIVGNLWDLPKKRPWMKMEEWTREYGAIYTLKLGRTTMIVLGRAPVAMELLDKRSAKYSSRPRLIMASELVSRGLRMTFMQYGDLWRKERKLLHQLTAPKAAASYEPIQDMESAQLVRDMIQKPKQFWGHCQRYAGSTIMQVAFNKRAKTPDDPAITEMRKCNEAMTKTAVAARYMVDSLPWLNYLPRALASWKKEADQIYDDTLALFSRHVNDVRKDMQEGQDIHCFARYILDLQKSYGLRDEEATFLAGAMYGAGSDTTADLISTFLLTITAHPEVLEKAHEELDRVIGRERMPEFADEPDLVYCGAVIREILRWRTVIAGGLAHCTTEDDVYEGYFIPKGTVVLPNHTAIHLDPEVYPEPEKYKPERFIKDGKLVGTKYSDRGHHAFGFGRRICPGIHIGERSLFIVYTRMLWACDIRKAKDSNGNEIPVDVNAFSEGFSSHPLPFQCDIKSRGPWVDEIVAAATANL